MEEGEYGIDGLHIYGHGIEKEKFEGGDLTSFILLVHIYPVLVLNLIIIKSTT